MAGTWMNGPEVSSADVDVDANVDDDVGGDVGVLMLSVCDVRV